MRTGLFACFLIGLATVPLRGQPIPRFGVYEATMEHLGEYDNPYRDLAATASIIRPDGTAWSVPCFWDGGKTWKFRVSPDMTGTWTWTIRASNPGLKDHSGSFECVASDLKGGIRPSTEYPYHFEHQDGSPFWWFGDTCWRMFATHNDEKVNRKTVEHYLDVRAAQGFNYVHVMLMSQSESAGENAGGKIFPETAVLAVNPKYFEECEARVRYMNDRGMTCGIVLGWGNWTPSWLTFGSDAQRFKFAEYVVARFSALNVAFIVAGEWHYSPHMQGTFANLARTMNEADPHGRIITIHAGPGKNISTKEFVTDDRWSLGDYQQAYFAPSGRESTDAERDELHKFLLASRDLDRPVVNAEYAYYLRDQNQDGLVDKPNSHTRTSFRRASWALAMAGGYFVTGFGSTYYAGVRHPGYFDVDDPRNDEAEADLVRIKDFFTKLEWWKLNPADEMVSGIEGVRYCLADPGHTYVVYTAGATSAVLQTAPPVKGAYTIRRYDPQTGAFPAVGESGSGAVTLHSPDTGDWVYLVQAK